MVCVVDCGGMALITHVVTAIISAYYEATARVRGGTAVDGTDAIPAPRLVVTPKAITPACLPAPSYPCTTLPPSLRHATGARWLLLMKDFF